MLNFTIRPGEYFTIGEDIKVIFTGGTTNNARMMVDAPKEYNIVRSKVLEKNTAEEEQAKLEKYYKEKEIPPEEVKRLIAGQKKEKQQKAKSESGMQ